MRYEILLSEETRDINVPTLVCPHTYNDFVPSSVMSHSSRMNDGVTSRIIKKTSRYKCANQTGQCFKSK